MTGLVRKATLLSAGGLIIAGAAMAGIPSPANCKIGGLAVDAARVGMYDASQNLTVLSTGQTFDIRDNTNAVVPNALVIIDATSDPFVSDGVGIDVACADIDVEFCTFQDAAWTGSNAAAGPGEHYQANADGAGKLFVTILGDGPDFTCGAGVANSTCASDDGTPPYAAPHRPKCAKVYADGGSGPVFLGKPIITNATYNLNTSGTVGLINSADGSQWLDMRSAYASGNTTGAWGGGYHSFGDYNGNGQVDSVDGSILQAAITAALTAPSCVVIP